MDGREAGAFGQEEISDAIQKFRAYLKANGADVGMITVSLGTAPGIKGVTYCDVAAGLPLAYSVTVVESLMRQILLQGLDDVIGL